MYTFNEAISALLNTIIYFAIKCYSFYEKKENSDINNVRIGISSKNLKIFRLYFENVGLYSGNVRSLVEMLSNRMLTEIYELLTKYYDEKERDWLYNDFIKRLKCILMTRSLSDN